MRAVLWAVSLKDMAKAVATKKKPVKMAAKKAVQKAPAPKKATKKNPKKAEVKKVAAKEQKRQTSAADLPPGPKVGGSHSLGHWQKHCPQCCTLAVC